MSEYKVEVHELCKNFGSLEVLKNCNFNIKRGEFVCVVGPTRYAARLGSNGLLDGRRIDVRAVDSDAYAVLPACDALYLGDIVGVLRHNPHGGFFVQSMKFEKDPNAR